MTGMSRRVAFAALCAVGLVSFSCTSGRTAAPPAYTRGPGALGTHGSVFFASETAGWVIAPHPARHETDIYRTVDGGQAWTLWSSLPEVAGRQEVPGTAVVAGESALLLVPAYGDLHSDHLMFRADGGEWERRTFPIVPPNVTVSVQFLPDLLHGWLLRDNYGDLFHTADGGRTWKVIRSFREFENAGFTPPVFWNATDGGMYDQEGNAFQYLVTHDSGVTWLTADMPEIHTKQDLGLKADLALSPDDLTMFDRTSGLLAISIFESSGSSPDPALRKLLYVTPTSDGAAHWAAAKLVRLPEAGQPEFLDSQRWVLTGDRHVYFTRDAGEHWREAEGLDIGLWRGHPLIQALQSKRNVVFLTFSMSDIEWLDVSTDGGEHWRPVPLPDVREATA